MLSTINVDHLNEAVVRVLRSETDSQQHSMAPDPGCHRPASFTGLMNAAHNAGCVTSLPLVLPMDGQPLIGLSSPIISSENNSVFSVAASRSFMPRTNSYPGASDLQQYSVLPPMMISGKRPQPIRPMPPPPGLFVLPRPTYAPLVPYHPTPVVPASQFASFAADMTSLLDASSYRPSALAGAAASSLVSLPSMAAFTSAAAFTSSAFPGPPLSRHIAAAAACGDLLPPMTRDADDADDDATDDGRDADHDDESDDSGPEAEGASVAGSFGNPSSMQEINVVDVLDDDETTRDLIGSLDSANQDLFAGPGAATSKADLPTAARSAADSVFDFILHNQVAMPTSNTTDVPAPAAADNADSSADVAPATNGITPYNPTYKGTYCVDCNRMYADGCAQHTSAYQTMTDSPVCSRARRSIPSQLFLRSINNCTEPNFIGVIAVEMIPSRTRFGPLIGLTTCKEDLIRPSETAYIWQLFDDDQPSKVLDCRDEERSNWLMFVKRARCSGEQNVMVCQEGDDIVFVTKRAVAPQTELLYWYASDYAQMLGVATRPEDFFSCARCGARCESAAELAAHARCHAGAPPRRWLCSLCGRQFSAAHHLRTHTHAHLGVKPYACAHCDKRFTDASNLHTHQRLHTGERRFACGVCGRAFRQKSHLDAHTPVHSGVRASQCRFCERMFARVSDVRQHERMHTRDNMHTCTRAGCGKAFWKIQNYKRHLKMHEGVRDYPCTHCSKAFATGYHMRRHLAVCKGSKRPAPTRGGTGSTTSLPTTSTAPSTGKLEQSTTTKAT